MVPENVIALAQAISTHYTGKPDDYLAHVSTAASFLKHAEAAGWVLIPGPTRAADPTPSA